MACHDPGLKAGEDKWLGLSDWLNERKGKSVTKEEVLDFIRKNQVEVEEVRYSAVRDFNKYGKVDSTTVNLSVFTKHLKGYVVVVEKEFDNSTEDLKTINTWGELSDVIYAQRTQNRTSETSTIGRSDAAKIRKDVEIAIKNDEKLLKQGGNSE